MVLKHIEKIYMLQGPGAPQPSALAHAPLRRPGETPLRALPLHPDTPLFARESGVQVIPAPLHYQKAPLSADRHSANKFCISSSPNG